MDNQKLFNLCLIISLFGVFILIIMVENIELKEIPISEIDIKYLEQDVKVSGIIENLFETEGLYIFEVRNNGSIKAILFKDNKTILYENIPVILEGEVTEYKNELEIISKRIILK